MYIRAISLDIYACVNVLKYVRVCICSCIYMYVYMYIYTLPYVSLQGINPVIPQALPGCQTDNFSSFSSITDTCHNEFGNFETATISSSNLIQNTVGSEKDDDFGDFAMQTVSFVPSSDVSSLVAIP